MIIAQQALHRTPKKASLAMLYRAVRRLVDTMDVRSWTHHYRAFNKMANCAANPVMDTRRSTQYTTPSEREAAVEIESRMHNDINRWLEHRLSDPDRIEHTGGTPPNNPTTPTDQSETTVEPSGTTSC